LNGMEFFHGAALAWGAWRSSSMMVGKREMT
jgi:hypothetical protein